MTPIISLTTERLLLRQWQPEDNEPFAALNADPEVMEHFPATLTRAESDALADRFSGLIATHGWGLWAVERLVDGVFMGFVGLHRQENLPFSPCTEVGWRLARAFWGHGYATEAARACMGFAFDVLHETSVVSFTAVSNERSQAVMRRIGMEQESYFEHPAVPVGHRIRPHVLFRLKMTPLCRGDGHKRPIMLHTRIGAHSTAQIFHSKDTALFQSAPPPTYPRPRFACAEDRQ